MFCTNLNIFLSYRNLLIICAYFIWVKVSSFVLSITICLNKKLLWKKWRQIIRVQNRRVCHKFKDYPGVAHFCSVTPACVLTKIFLYELYLCFKKFFCFFLGVTILLKILNIQITVGVGNGEEAGMMMFGLVGLPAHDVSRIWRIRTIV